MKIIIYKSFGSIIGTFGSTTGSYGSILLQEVRVAGVVGSSGSSISCSILGLQEF